MVEWIFQLSHVVMMTNTLLAISSDSGDQGFSVVAALITLVVMSLIAFLISLPKRIDLKKRCTADAMGVIIEERVAYRHPRLGNHLAFKVQFFSCYGEDVKVEIGCDEVFRIYQIGDHVRLKYDPHDPQTFYVNPPSRGLESL